MFGYHTWSVLVSGPSGSLHKIVIKHISSSSLLKLIHGFVRENVSEFRRHVELNRHFVGWIADSTVGYIYSKLWRIAIHATSARLWTHSTVTKRN